MNLQSLAKKAQLVKLTLDSEEIVKEYGDSIDFYISDDVSLQQYFDFYKLQGVSNFDGLLKLVRSLLKNEDGLPVLAADETLPVLLQAKVLERVANFLAE